MKLCAFPTSEPILLRFLAYLGKKCLSHRTIKVYLAAIRHYHVVEGYNYCGCTPRMHLVIQGIKRCNGVVQRSRLPITADMLRVLKRAWRSNATSFDNIMLWADCNVGFFGFLRCGEFTLPDGEQYSDVIHLSLSAVSFDADSTPSIVSIRLKASKTDPFRVGVVIHLARTGQDICPVAALAAYVRRRGTKAGPLFQWEGGVPLRKSKFISAVRQALASQGVDSTKYAGHSFRIGAATTAAMHGVPESTIKLLGRWESSAYQTYIQTPREKLASLSKSLAR